MGMALSVELMCFSSFKKIIRILSLTSEKIVIPV